MEGLHVGWMEGWIDRWMKRWIFINAFIYYKFPKKKSFFSLVKQPEGIKNHKMFLLLIQ